MEEVLLEACGVSGRLVLFRNVVRIQRFGLLGFLRRASRVEQDIVIAQIKSIRFGRAGFLGNGYIEFDIEDDDVPGGTKASGAGELAVSFRPGQQKAFEAFRSALEERIHSLSRMPTPATTDLDELEKLASLRDRKVITEEEFARKKRQLLGF